MRGAQPKALTPAGAPPGRRYTRFVVSAGRIGRPTLVAVVLALAAPALAQFGPRGGEADARPGRGSAGWPSFEQLVTRSTTIVAGEVVAVESSWNADRTEIFTTVTLRADHHLLDRGRNRIGDLVRFQVPGGTVGTDRLLVTHMATFRVGEQALVFLAEQGPRLPRVVAGEAGKRTLRPDPDGGWQVLPGFASTDGASGTPTLAELADQAASLLAAGVR